MALKPNDQIIELGCGGCRKEDKGFNCYSEDDMVKCFWATNIAKQPHKFDFDQNFENILPKITNKLAEHGLLGPKAYGEYLDDIVGDKSTDLKDYAFETDYLNISTDELREAVIDYVSKKAKKTFEGYSEYDDLKKLKKDIQARRGKDYERDTLLFDRAIHAEHVTGDLLDIYPPLPELREKFEKEIMD